MPQCPICGADGEVDRLVDCISDAMGLANDRLEQAFWPPPEVQHSDYGVYQTRDGETVADVKVTFEMNQLIIGFDGDREQIAADLADQLERVAAVLREQKSAYEKIKSERDEFRAMVIALQEKCDHLKADLEMSF